ncbi:MAG: hypothetical protein QS748_14625, partial [Candidatus Endonucleobacter bathymodioli]|nr:hypothetical protein [Candidatus Endonucleobacter bathymodioli]
MKIIFFNGYVFLRMRNNDLYDVYKKFHNMLSCMFIMLMLVFCQQCYSVIEDEWDKDEDKIEWKKSSLKSIFFDNIINAYSSWCHGNNVKTAIIGSTGISILNGDSCLNDIKDIDIIINDKEEAGRLITHLNSIVQGVIYTIKDDNLTDLVTIGYRPVGENKELSDKAPECGKITMFDIKSNDPIAAVDIVVKDLGENDQMFIACEYYFKYGCKAENKEKASIPVLSPASYAMLDYSSMKSDMEYLRNCGDGAEVILDDNLKEVLYVCQNLNKVRTRLPFYKRLKVEKSNDVELMRMIGNVSFSYGDLVEKINKRTDIVEIIHKKACAFDYVLDSASDSQHLLTHAEWVKVLWDDFSICENDTDAVSFCCSLTKAINANCIIKERFLKSVSKIQIENSGVASGIVTPSLVGVFIYEWINMVISALCNDKNDGDEKSIPSTVFLNIVSDGAFLNDAGVYDLRREATDFFSCLNPLLPLVLSTGIPVVVFSPAKYGKRVISTLLSPDYAWRKWPLLMKFLSKIGNFITTENTLMKDLVFIAHSGSDRYYLCMKKFAKAKKIDPLLTAEELLLGKEEYAFENSKADSERAFASDLHVMDVMMKPCTSEKIAEVHDCDVYYDCDEYMELEKKLDNMCLGENNEVVMGTREIKEGGAVSNQYDCLVEEKTYKDFGSNKSEKISSLIKRALVCIDIGVDVGMEPERVAVYISNTSVYRGRIDDVCDGGSQMLWENTECKQEITSAININNVNDIMRCVFDAVSATCKKERGIMIYLDKCGDVIEQLSRADNLGCPLAPLIIGVYQMTKLVNKGIWSEQVIDIIQYFIKAVMRGNTQGVSCLYWLAEMTGSPQAFSLSMFVATIFNKYFSDKIVSLHFVLPQIGYNVLDEPNNISLPVVVGRCSSQKNNIEVSNVLKKTYPRYSELGGDSSLWEFGQSKSVADRIAYASHLAFYYLYSGDREKASIEFKEAVLAYAWLVGKIDDVLVIPNIIKAAGRSALYNVINCEKDSSYQYNDDFNNLRSCVEKEGGVYDFLWAVKSTLSHGELSPLDYFRNRIKCIVIKKSEGVVFENNNDLEDQLFEHNVLLDGNTINEYSRYAASNILKLNLAGAGARRKINKYKRQPSHKTVHNVRGCDGIYELFLGGAKAVDRAQRLHRDKMSKMGRVLKSDSDLYETNNMVPVFMFALSDHIETFTADMEIYEDMVLGNECVDVDRLVAEMRGKYTATFNDIVSQ